MNMGVSEGIQGQAGGTHDRSCPMCGEEATPCWECISTGVFDETWCDTCENRAECRTAFKRDRLSGEYKEEYI